MLSGEELARRVMALDERGIRSFLFSLVGYCVEQYPDSDSRELLSVLEEYLTGTSIAKDQAQDYLSKKLAEYLMKMLPYLTQSALESKYDLMNKTGFESLLKDTRDANIMSILQFYLGIADKNQVLGNIVQTTINFVQVLGAYKVDKLLRDAINYAEVQ